MMNWTVMWWVRGGVSGFPWLIVVGGVLSLGPFAARTVRECVARMQCVGVFGDAFCVWEWFLEFVVS